MPLRRAGVGPRENKKMTMPHALQTPNLFAALAAAALCACGPKPPSDRVRVSGQVEATDVQIAPQVGGRLLELRVAASDLGKVIGKQGRTARAIRTLLGASGMKHNRRFTLEILE